MKFKVITGVTLLVVTGSSLMVEASEPSQIIPPGTLNATGPLSSFLEQLGSQTGGGGGSVPPAPLSIQQSLPPQLQPAPPQQAYSLPGNTAFSYQQPQPIPQPIPQPQNPIDPALERLLQSFSGAQVQYRDQNGHPHSFNIGQTAAAAYAQAPPATITIQQVTCFVGCSHITNYPETQLVPLAALRSQAQKSKFSSFEDVKWFLYANVGLILIVNFM